MNITKHKYAFAALAAFALAVPASAENLVSYTGTFTETDHPTLTGAHVVTLKSNGTLTVTAPTGISFGAGQHTLRFFYGSVFLDRLGSSCGFAAIRCAARRGRKYDCSTQKKSDDFLFHVKSPWFIED